MINMAAKKKKGSKKKGTKRRRPTKKRVVRHAPKKHLAANAGLAVTVYKVATDAEGTMISPVQALFYPYDSMQTRVAAVVRKVASNLMETKNTGPALIGLTMSYGEDLPLVGGLYKDIIKKPADRLLSKVEKGLTGKKRGRWKW